MVLPFTSDLATSFSQEPIFMKINITIIYLSFLARNEQGETNSYLSINNQGSSEMVVETYRLNR